MKFKMTPDYLNMRLDEDLQHSNFLLIEKFIESIDVDKRAVFYRFERNGEFIRDESGEIVYDYDDTKDYNLEKFKKYYINILINKAKDLLEYKIINMKKIEILLNKRQSTGITSLDIQYEKVRLIENELKTGNVWGNIIAFSKLVDIDLKFSMNLLETSLNNLNTKRIFNTSETYFEQAEKLFEAEKLMNFELNTNSFRPKEDLILHNPDFTPEKREELEKIPDNLLLNSFLFVHELYCGVLDIPVHIYIKDKSLFDDKNYNIIGMCDGSKIMSKPKNNTYGVMLISKENGTTFWCHVTKSEALWFFKK